MLNFFPISSFKMSDLNVTKLSFKNDATFGSGNTSLSICAHGMQPVKYKSTKINLCSVVACFLANSQLSSAVVVCAFTAIEVQASSKNALAILKIGFIKFDCFISRMNV